MVESTSQFSKDFIENYHEDSDEGYFLKVNFQYPEKLNVFHDDLLFSPKKIKTENFERLVANLHYKK